MLFLPQEVIRQKRDGGTLGPEALQRFMAGIASGRIPDSQIAALAMAIFFRGMDTGESVALTLAMRDSGQVLDWSELPGPVVDKHSTGGVGDLVSLVLGPMVAACGGFVPMISGRGLGHTGGTLDKLEAISGYQTRPDPVAFRRVVRQVGVAIVGQTEALAPADRRFYAVRDVTATVESIPLITASILSKKFAAGLQALVMDVKTGNGAFMATPEAAQALAERIVTVGEGAGLPTRALITDMNQPLAPAAGNALEVHAALDYLTGSARPERLHAVTVALGEAMLLAAGLAEDAPQARVQLLEALESGAAAERFGRMVHALGGPIDLLTRPHRWLVPAPETAVVTAGRTGYVTAIDTRALGLVVCQLGGGRQRPEDTIDPRVGLSCLAERGQALTADTVLARVHAADPASLAEAVAAVRAAFTLGDTPPEMPLLIRSVQPMQPSTDRKHP